MIQTAVDLIVFLEGNFPFLLSLIAYAILAIALSKSIKQHARVYYWALGVISFGFAIPVIARAFGLSLPSIMATRGRTIAKELSDAATFLHPVLIIIMYIGA